MAELEAVRLAINSQTDVIVCRKKVRESAILMGFGLADQTRLATAVSELARNALRHGGGGICLIRDLEIESRYGLEVLIEDDGPGIADIEQALKDGYSTDRSLGLGLPAARRLVHVLHIDSQPGRTCISMKMYLQKQAA